jgi:hypothetical protein
VYTAAAQDGKMEILGLMICRVLNSVSQEVSDAQYYYPS